MVMRARVHYTYRAFNALKILYTFAGSMYLAYHIIRTFCIQNISIFIRAASIDDIILLCTVVRKPSVYIAAAAAVVYIIL